MTKKNNKKESFDLKKIDQKWIWIGVGILIIVLLAVYFMNSSPAEKCDNLDCFIANADECKSTTYLETSEIGTIKYSISADCILTKEIVELSENEDSFLKNALKGKKMECTYSKGNFNGQWVISMIEGLEDCSGDLKDAVANLLLTV